MRREVQSLRIQYRAPSITVDSKGRDPGARGPRDGGRKWRIVSKCDCSQSETFTLFRKTLSANRIKLGEEIVKSALSKEQGKKATMAKLPSLGNKVPVNNGKFSAKRI